MGGLLILIAVLLPVLLWGRLDNRLLMVVLLSTIWMGLIGLLDDYLKVVKHCSKGLVGRYKLAGQFLLGIALGIWLCFSPVQGETLPGTSVVLQAEAADPSGLDFVRWRVDQGGWNPVPAPDTVVTLDGTATDPEGETDLDLAWFVRWPYDEETGEYINEEMIGVGRPVEWSPSETMEISCGTGFDMRIELRATDPGGSVGSDFVVATFSSIC